MKDQLYPEEATKDVVKRRRKKACSWREHPKRVEGGVLTFREANMALRSWVMVDRPVMGCVLFKMIC